MVQKYYEPSSNKGWVGFLIVAVVLSVIFPFLIGVLGALGIAVGIRYAVSWLLNEWPGG